MAVAVKDISASVRALVQKKSALIAVGGVLLGTTTMMVTNPGKAAYIDYASERLAKETQRACNDFDGNIHVGHLLKLPTEDLCRSFAHGTDAIGVAARKQQGSCSQTRRFWAQISCE